MKKIYFAGAVLCAAVLMAGCSSEEATENVSYGNFTLSATVGADTRTTVNDTYEVLWSNGDKIYVYGEGVNATLDLQGEGGSKSGTFAGTLKGTADNLKYAVYPVPTGDSKTTINLKPSYDYASPIVTNSPMYAAFGADKSQVTFKHLCAMMRLTIYNVPTDGTKTLTLTSNDGNITGDFTLTDSDNGLTLTAPATDGKTITVNNISNGQPANGTLKVDIPLPAGTYTNGISVSLKQGDNTVLAEKTINNIQLTEGYIMVMPELTYFSVEGTTSSFEEPEQVSASDIASTDFTDATKSYVIKGNSSSDEADITLSEKKTIVAKSVVMEDINISSTQKLTLQAEQVTLNGVTLTGDQPKANDNAQVSINNAKSVNISDVTLSKTNGYNAIEIGLGDGNVPSEINIDNVTVSEALSNNAILIFGTESNAVVNITNCDFGTVSNCLRLSNKTNATGVKVNIKDCTVTAWDTNFPWRGFLIMEDYTNKSSDAAATANLFGNNKITVTFDNVTNPSGTKIDFTGNVAAGAPADSSTDNVNQVYYVCRDYAGSTYADMIVPYGDGSAYPTFIFK